MKRYAPLIKDKAISQEEYDDAVQANLEAEASVVRDYVLPGILIALGIYLCFLDGQYKGTEGGWQPLDKVVVPVIIDSMTAEVAGELVGLLSDERLDVNLRRSIASALAAYANDISIIEGLIKLLQDKEISDSVYSALWTISRRAGVWIFPMHLRARTGNVKQSQAQYEIIPWE